MGCKKSFPHLSVVVPFFVLICVLPILAVYILFHTTYTKWDWHFVFGFSVQFALKYPEVSIGVTVTVNRIITAVLTFFDYVSLLQKAFKNCVKATREAEAWAGVPEDQRVGDI